MKKIIIKGIIAIVLGALLAKESEMGFGAAILICILMYAVISWFGMIYRSLYAFGGVLRCIISLVGSIVIYALPMTILEALLPNNWLRSALTAISTIIIFLIPFVRDWRAFKAERMQLGEGIKNDEDERC